jgi:hypothetical protein
MIWRVDWGIVLQRQLREFQSWEAAARLCEAIVHFAETGSGPVTQYDPENPRRLKVKVRGAVGYLFANERTGVLYAARAYERLT